MRGFNKTRACCALRYGPQIGNHLHLMAGTPAEFSISIPSSAGFMERPVWELLTQGTGNITAASLTAAGHSDYFRNIDVISRTYD